MRNLIVGMFLFVSACATAPAPSPVTVAPPAGAPVTSEAVLAAAVNAPDRLAADRDLDAGRHPVEFLQFTGVTSGMHVADLGAAGGYTTELLARIVGPKGIVYAQNSPVVLQHIGEAALQARLSRAINSHVVRVDREFDSPLPPAAHDLDLIVMNIFYHDTVWLNVDRTKMNQAIFGALRSGGSFVVADTSAKAGTGTADAKTLHRIDEQVVRKEVLAAGFQLAAESDILRNANDARDWNASPKAAGPKRGTNDRFLLRFVKP